MCWDKEFHGLYKQMQEEKGSGIFCLIPTCSFDGASLQSVQKKILQPAEGTEHNTLTRAGYGGRNK